LRGRSRGEAEGKATNEQMGEQFTNIQEGIRSPLFNFGLALKSTREA
jgi:hypothetical protein